MPRWPCHLPCLPCGLAEEIEPGVERRGGSLPRCLLLGAFPPSGQAGVCDKACVTALATCRALGSTRNNLARRALPWVNKGGWAPRGRRWTLSTSPRQTLADDEPLRFTGSKPVRCPQHTRADLTLRDKDDYQAVISANAIWAALLPWGLQRGSESCLPGLSGFPSTTGGGLSCISCYCIYLSNVCSVQRKFQCDLPPACPPPSLSLSLLER